MQTFSIIGSLATQGRSCLYMDFRERERERDRERERERERKSVRERGERD